MRVFCASFSRRETRLRGCSFFSMVPPPVPRDLDVEDFADADLPVDLLL
jgi:hypothetical protein